MRTTYLGIFPAILGALAAVLAAVLAAAPACAHPHVWVTAKAEVVYSQGQIVAIDHHWTFDEFYTAMAIEGLDKNGDGIYSREELSELAQVNMQGLKEFEYFTYAMTGKQRVDVGTPTDPWLEHKDGVLTLHYRLPLAKPLPQDTKGFALAVFDPSYFIAFEMAKENPVTLAGAPAGCKITFGAAAEPQSSGEPSAPAFGAPSTKAAYVTCAHS